MRRAAALAAVLLAGCGLAAGADGFALELRAEPVALGAERVGPLRFAGGLRLTAETARFGGLSGLEVLEAGDGLRATAVTDTGDVVAFDLLFTEGRLTGVGPGAIRRLRVDGSRELDGKAEADAEGLARDEDRGTFIVSFERRSRIHDMGEVWGASVADAPIAAPRVELPENSGFEGLALLPIDGHPTLVAGAEDGRMWTCPRNGEGCAELKLERSPPALGYRLTSLDRLPGTDDLVASYRAYDPILGWRWMLAWVDLRKAADGPSRVVELARFTGPLIRDNVEGVAAVALPGRGWRLFAVSDDNYSPRQRTLLLAFDWIPANEKGPARGRPSVQRSGEAVRRLEPTPSP